MSLPPGFRPLAYRPIPKRTLLERLMLRSRLAHRVAAAAMARLPSGRLRRLYLERLVFQLSYGAMNRRDFHAFKQLYFPEDLVARFEGEPLPGMGSVFHGREAMNAAYLEWISGWRDLERVPVAYAERGETLVVLTRQHGVGAASGLTVTSEVGQVYRVRGGLAAEYVECQSWEEAIRIGGMEG